MKGIMLPCANNGQLQTMANCSLAKGMEGLSACFTVCTHCSRIICPAIYASPRLLRMDCYHKEAFSPARNQCKSFMVVCTVKSFSSAFSDMSYHFQPETITTFWCRSSHQLFFESVIYARTTRLQILTIQSHQKSANTVICGNLW